ncbi:MAG: LysM peptidoglycan-binding domain-containing protein [Candidatus Melainabacteria bacterium]|nr:LysM peptidoglycan-binding domain-containing protein [Candidatus Melainabacteria bacterium]
MANGRPDPHAKVEPSAQNPEGRQQTRPGQLQAEGELNSRFEKPDAGRVEGDAVTKMQMESGIFGPGQGRFEDLRRTMDRTSNAGNVDRRLTTFDTSEGPMQGILHTGKNGTFFTTAGGERFRYEPAPSGESGFSLTSTNNGRALEVLQQRSETSHVNMIPDGPARVWKPGEPVRVTPPAALDSPRIIRDGAPPAMADGPPVRADSGSGPGQAFDAARAQRLVEQMQTDPRNQEFRKAFGEIARHHPEQTNELIKQMQSEGQQLPRNLESWSRAFENRRADFPQDSGAMRADKIPQGEFERLAQRNSELNQQLKDPEFRRQLIEKLQALKGEPGKTEVGKSEMAARLGSGDDQSVLKPESLLKALKLDGNDPATKQFLTELGKRLSQLPEGQPLGQLRLDTLLKGLDPQRASALEKFLLPGGKDTGSSIMISQVDQARFASLRQVLSGTEASLTMSPVRSALSMLVRQSETLSAVEPRSGLRAIGKVLSALDTSVPVATAQDQAVKPMRLLDVMAQTLDTRAQASNSGDFAARLSPAQILVIRSMLDTGMSATASDIAQRRVEPPAGQIDSSALVRGDLAARPGMVPGTGARPAGAETGSEVPQQRIEAGQSSAAELIAGKPIDAVTGLPYDPHTGKLLDPATGKEIGNVRPSEMSGKLSETDGKKKDKELSEEEEKDLEDKKIREKDMLLLMQEQKDRELRERKLKEAKLAQEDKKRRRYVVKKGDTLESIAEKELRDPRLAALIYDINKKIIPTRDENGKQVAYLPRGLIIWLPSPAESREFRSKLMTGRIGAPDATMGSGTAGKYTTPEEELAARFGERWDGPTDDTNVSSDAPAEDNKIRDEWMANAVAKAEQRRKNIEEALGPIGPRKVKKPDGRLQYVIRLGDSLKSIAMKHPAIKDVSLWKLIAEVNGLTTETDSRGVPTAKVTRGATIALPSNREIAEYRERLGLNRAKLIGSASQSGVTTDFASKKCPECGRLAVSRATICPCGYEFEESEVIRDAGGAGSETGRAPDAATIVLQAAGSIDDALRTPKQAGDPAAGAPAPTSSLESDTVFQTPSISPVLSPPKRLWPIVHNLADTVRLVKSVEELDIETTSMEVALEVKVEEDWQMAVCYEIMENRTYRHDYTSRSGRKSVKIDLPAKAAQELAHNDLTSNWGNYEKKLSR